MICAECLYRFWLAVELEGMRLWLGGRPYTFITLEIAEGFRCPCNRG